MSQRGSDLSEGERLVLQRAVEIVSSVVGGGGRGSGPSEAQETSGDAEGTGPGSGVAATPRGSRSGASKWRRKLY